MDRRPAVRPTVVADARACRAQYTLLGGLLDLAVDLAAVIPDAVTYFINKHLPRR